MNYYYTKGEWTGLIFRVIQYYPYTKVYYITNNLNVSSVISAKDYFHGQNTRMPLC